MLTADHHLHPSPRENVAIIEVEAMHQLFAQHGAEHFQALRGKCLRCGNDIQVEISKTSGGYGFQGGVLVSARQNFYIICCDCLQQSGAGQENRKDSCV